MLIKRKFLLILIIILISFFMIFFTYTNNELINENTMIKYSTSLDLINERMLALSFDINNFPRDVKDDLIFLSKLTSLSDLINGSLDKSSLEKDYLSFMEQTNTYYQIRYIDELGNEIVRVEYDGNLEKKIIETKNLQNKADQYYFQESMKLDKGETYISKLDLNVENGEIENRGNKKNPKHVPVIRYATPIFDEKQNRKGILITNVYANSFLKEIQNFQRAGEVTYLIDQDGYYLFNPDKEKEFSFMFEDKDFNFFNEYEEFSKDEFLDEGKRTLKPNGKIFTYRFLSPILGSSSYGLEEQINDNFWILVTVTDKSELEKPLKLRDKLIRENYLILIAIILVIFFLFYILEFDKNKK